MATRSVLGGSRSIWVLGGSGIIKGGFERSVLVATWERRIGDVRGEMGFANVRESFALVDQVHAELNVGGGEVKWLGYGGTARRSVGDLGPTSTCGVELRLSRWCVGWN